MKLINKFSYMLLAGAAVCIAPSCSDIDDEVTSANYAGAFRPTDLKATLLKNNISVHLDWTCVGHPDSYDIEVSKDTLFAGEPCFTTSATDTVTISAYEAGMRGKEVYFIRVRSSKGDIKSEWSSVRVETKEEQSFKNIMSGDNSLTVNWVSGINVNLLTVKAEGDTVTTECIIDEETKSKAQMIVPNLLPAKEYTLTLLEGEYKHGKQTVATGFLSNLGFDLSGEFITFGSNGQREWKTANGFSLSVKDDKKNITIVQDSVYFGNTTYAKRFNGRLKTGDKSEGEHLLFEASVPQNGRLFVYACSGNADNSSVRTIGLVQGKDTVLNEALNDKDAVTINVEGKDVKAFPVYYADVVAGKVKLAFDEGAIHLYGMKFVPLNISVQQDFDADSVAVWVDEEVAPTDQDTPSDPQPVVTYGKGELLTFVTAAAGTVPASFEKEAFSFVIKDDNGKAAVDENNQYFGDTESYVNFTTRLKSNTKTSSVFGYTLNAKKDGNIIIYMRSSSSADSRDVTIGSYSFTVGDTNKTTGTVVAADGTVTEDKSIFTPYILEGVKAGESYPFTFNGNINIYGIEYVEGTSDGSSPEPQPEEKGTFLGGITAAQLTVGAAGTLATYALDGVDCPAINYTGAGEQLDVTVAAVPGLTLQYKNSGTKDNFFVFGPSFIQTGGKNAVVELSGLTAGQKVTLTFSAKGSTAAVVHAQAGCTGDDVTNADKENYQTATFVATDATIQIKETSGGMRISRIAVE